MWKTQEGEGKRKKGLHWGCVPHVTMYIHDSDLLDLGPCDQLLPGLQAPFSVPASQNCLHHLTMLEKTYLHWNEVWFRLITIVLQSCYVCFWHDYNILHPKLALQIDCNGISSYIKMGIAIKPLALQSDFWWWQFQALQYIEIIFYFFPTKGGRIWEVLFCLEVCINVYRE